MKEQLIIASASNIIKYSCGCIVEWPFIGIFAHIKEPHIIPCYSHQSKINQIEKLATQDWENITSNSPRKG